MKKIITIALTLCLMVCGTSIGGSAADIADNKIFHYNGNIDVLV